MATIAEQLEALTLRDNFNRANESPMVSANWTKLSWCKVTGKIDGERWTPATGFTTQEDGAYWSPSAFANPAAIGVDLFKENLTERWIALWAALNPGTQSGYRLKVVQTATSTKLEWRLEEITGGGVALHKSGFIEGVAATGATGHSFAITVLEGEVKAWLSKEGLTAWEELGSVEDVTYTEGHTAVEGRGFGVNCWNAFHAGALKAEGEEEGVHQPNAATATASVPTPEISAPMQPDSALATASIPSGVDLVGGAATSATEREAKGLPLPHPSVLANPGRLGPPRFTSAERKTLRIDRNG